MVFVDWLAHAQANRMEQETGINLNKSFDPQILSYSSKVQRNNLGWTMKQMESFAAESAIVTVIPDKLIRVAKLLNDYD